MTIYFVAGEASGDSRGAELMRSLREKEPALELAGLGGMKMRAIAGAHLEDWSDEAGVIGFIDVLKKYAYFKRRFDDTLAEIARTKPDAVVLIDYPGFNLRLATALKQRGDSPRVIYYISPQVWAWNRGRIPKMARVIDLMLCIFPFEQALYQESGLKTIFVGHPMVDALGDAPVVARDEKLVALFPGSRDREVRKIFPVMLAASEKLLAHRNDLKFAAAAASKKQLHLMEMIARDSGAVSCVIGLKNSRELMAQAAVGMVASGTATLEAAFLRLPYVLVYRVAWLTSFVGRRLIRVPFLGIVNILGGREIVREFVQTEARPNAIAAEVLRLLEDGRARADLVAQLGEVVVKLGEPGASARAAAAILFELKAR